MDTFITGFISGIISILAIGIFIWTLRGRKAGSPDSLKGRIDKNNISTGHGIDELKKNNNKSGKIIDEAQDTAGSGIKSINDTEKSISKLIAAAERKRRKGD